MGIDRHQFKAIFSPIRKKIRGEVKDSGKRFRCLIGQAADGREASRRPQQHDEGRPAHARPGLQEEGQRGRRTRRIRKVFHARLALKARRTTLREVTSPRP